MIYDKTNLKTKLNLFNQLTYFQYELTVLMFLHK